MGALEYTRRVHGSTSLDGHGNTGDGIHIASCGGTWLALVAGFGGLRDADGDVRFAAAPAASSGTRLHFRIEVRGQGLSRST